MKARMNLRRGTFKWTRFADLVSPSCDGWALANGWRNQWSSDSQFEFQFGAYGWTKVRVWADHLEDAFEEAVEWLDDHAPGHLISEDEFAELCLEAAKELGLDPTTDDESEQEAIREVAEADLTTIGHTTLKHGSHIASYEWTVTELS